MDRLDRRKDYGHKHPISTDFAERLKLFDLFGKEMPVFNVKGISKVNTWVGGIVSIIIFGTTFVFMLLKFQHLM